MKETKGYCPFCSLACPLVIRGGVREPVFTNRAIYTLDWDGDEGSKYGGSLCARGNTVIEFMTHPKRLNYPFVMGERTTLEAAVEETAKSLSGIIEDFGRESVGVLLGENLTNEEAALAIAFAREVLGNGSVALFAPDDMPVIRAHSSIDLSDLKPAGGKPGGDREVALLVGDPFSEHPCTAKLVLPGKYASRGSEVIVVSPECNHTAWFSNRYLRCRPGGEAAVLVGLLKAVSEKCGAGLPAELGSLAGGLGWGEIEGLGGVAGPDLEEAAGSMLGAARVRTYVSNIFGRFGSPALTAVLAEAVTRLCPGEREYSAQFVQQNTLGIYNAIRSCNGGKVLERIEGEELKAMVLLGLDLFSVYPAAPVEKALREKKFTVTTQLFWNQTASRANVVIPAAGLMEKKGTVSPAFGEEIVRDGSISPIGGTIADGDFLVALARRMGANLSAGAPKKEVARGGGAWVTSEWSGYVETLKGLDSAQAVLIPRADPVHVADGSLSRNFHWSMVTCPEPVLAVSGELAAGMKLKNGDRVKVTAAGGEALLTVEVTDRLEGNVVGATIHFPSVRRLFKWELDSENGEAKLAPEAVTLKPQSDKS